MLRKWHLRQDGNYENTEVVKMIKRRQHGWGSHLSCESSRCKGSVVMKPSFLCSVNKGQPLELDAATELRKQELRLERWIFTGRSKGKDTVLRARGSHWGVSITHYLMCSLLFTLTLLYSKPLLLISHSLCTSKTGKPTPSHNQNVFTSVSWVFSLGMYLCHVGEFIH